MTTKAPGKRNVESIRIFGASWDDLNVTAPKVGSARSTLAADAAEALNNYLRCERCREPVPVVWGDLTGTDLAHALTAAIKARVRQKCSAHGPVLIGAQRASPVAADSAPAGRARQLQQDIPGLTTASELAGPAMKFRSPEPADEPFTPQPVPVPPVPKRAKQGLAVDCRHPIGLRNGDICGKCHRKVGAKR